MLYNKKGFPEESELVLCAVTKVQYDSVFVNLNEYNKQGVIHISEISPGRIRNIRDFVREGKIIICKVLRVNQERGHIDLSLRRVTDMQRRQKANAIKQEQKAEKIIEGISKKLKKNFNKVYYDIAPKILERYEYLFECFEDIVEDNFSLSDVNIDKKLADEVTKAVKEKIKPKEVEIKGNFNIEIYDSKGIDLIKEALKKNLNDNINISYVGAGTYKITITAKDYKKAENMMNEYVEKIKKFIEKKDGKVKFTRLES
jgi:translation initiation factor 2 subunit 1